MLTRQTLQVVVASRNPVKREAVRRAFRRFFPQAALHLESVAVPSGVGEQPMSEAETRRGARQRAERARQAVPQADFWVGLEGGVAPAGETLLAFAWMAVLRADGVWGEARTAAFVLPPRVAGLLRQGYELGEADDRVFGEENSKQKMGAVGLLTGGLIDRASLYEHALLLALIPYGEGWQRAQ